MEAIGFLVGLLLERVYIFVVHMDFVFQMSAKVGFFLSERQWWGAQSRQQGAEWALPLSCSYRRRGWACRTQREPELESRRRGWPGRLGHLRVVWPYSPLMPLRSGMGHHERLELEPGGAVLISPKPTCPGPHAHLKGIGHGGGRGGWQPGLGLCGHSA